MKGRGAGHNPANRFERLELDWEVPPPEKVPTQYLVDSSRSIISTNTSPDVGFDASLNPYRGCSHGCSYCLDGATNILMADGSVRALADVQQGDEIYGTVRRGNYRRYVRTKIRSHWSTRQLAYRVQLADGTELIAGPNHRFLTDRGWKFVVGTQQGAHRRPHLTTNNKLIGTGVSAAEPDDSSPDYRRGYLCGMIRGDGHLASYSYPPGWGRATNNLHQFRLALVDDEALYRTRRYLQDEATTLYSFNFQAETPTRRTIEAIRTSARSSVDKIKRIVQWPDEPSSDWKLGFLAGIFDAEGSYSAVIRISNTDPEILNHIQDALSAFSFNYVVETPRREQRKPIKVIRLVGGLRECLRFWHATNPAISRKRDIEGLALKSDADLRVLEIELLEGDRELFDIETGTGDFLANGVVSHNCYARNTHEYLGFSAGLDFESKILVKPDAPDLLREQLASRKWQPQPLALSGVTDPYQPVERKLEVTRGCLAVLAEARNPTLLITKNRLMTRDLDLLEELNRHQAVSAALSITTLDGELARVMEPQASHPRDRLRALSELSAAGIPTSVMIAPVIPGLTDHELPAILEAAAEAGAERAGYVLLKLPGVVEEIFLAWLEEHFPERRAKVLSRIRAFRDGTLNQSDFAVRGRGSSALAREFADFFAIQRRCHGLDRPRPELSVDHFRRPESAQRRLF